MNLPTLLTSTLQLVFAANAPALIDTDTPLR